MDHALFDDIPIGLLAVRRAGDRLTIRYANRSAESMLGTALAGRDFTAAWPGPEAADLALALCGHLPPTEAILPFTADGRPSWALVTIAREDGDGGDDFSLWATDISASKQAEETFRRAAAHADALIDQKSNFLATISHEIRTPMQSVYGLLEMIELDNPSPAILAMAQTARSSASGLLEILDDVLDFAKMDADQMELDAFEVPVRTLARGILEAMAVKVAGKNITLKDDIAADVPFVVVGDPKRLRQVIVNLMGNAMKFTREGQIILRIARGGKALADPRRGLVLRFEIIDTGIGMSAEISSRLFQPFSQADNTTSRKYGGTGLGLSICKKLVQLMGGVIGVDSSPGRGSTFWFEIPTEDVATDATILALPSLDGLSVLSVEDHPLGAREIVKSLKSMGARVESCATIADALALVKRKPFDVGLIDQGLPDGLGLDLIRQIMEIRPFMGLVMYTVRDDAGMQHSLQSLGVAYLGKPASRIGLGEAVRDAATRVIKGGMTGPRRMIIAEDTAIVRDILRRQLEKLGVEATFVRNGREAIDAVRSGEYGILLTDLHMPELDGYGLVRDIREDDARLGRHFPVIALTADVQMAQQQVYIGRGFDECMLKPVSLGQFRRLLVRWGLLDDARARGDAGHQPGLSANGERATAIDRNAMIAQMGGFDEGAIEMLKLFVDMTRPLMETIDHAAQARDFTALENAAHSLKGAARSACLNDLGEAAARLEYEAEQKSAIHPHLAAAQREFARAEQEIALL